MALLKGRHYPLTGNYTQVATASTAGATSLDVDSTAGFSVNDFILAGIPGEEGAEIVRITAITDLNTLAVTAMTYAHTVDDHVYSLPYDMIEFSRRASSGGTSEVITTKTMQYENANYTFHDYPNASTSDYYAIRYCNSYTSNFSEYSDEYQIPSMYCTVEEVMDYLGMQIRDDSELEYDRVEKLILNITSEIDLLTNTSFKSNTISTSNYEYIDGVGGKLTIEGEDGYRTSYFLSKRPVISISELSVTADADTADSPTWNSLTENTDYYLDKNTGRIDIVTSNYFPPKGNKRIRIAYTYGRNSIPYEIKKLCSIMVVRDLMLMGASSTIIMKGTAYDRAQTQILDMEIERIINRYRVYDMRIV